LHKGEDHTVKDDFYERYKVSYRSNAPRYIQLRDALLSAIEDGYWKPGSKLPSEMDISRSAPFSLGTVQKALRMLTDHGVIERRHGHGTFVSGKTVVPWHCRFLSSEDASFFPVHPRVIDRKIIRSTTGWARQLAPDGSDLIRMNRIVDVEQKFSIFSSFYVPLRRFRSFWEKPLQEFQGMNLKSILRKEYGVPITHTSNFVRLLTLKPAICRALGVPGGTQGMLLEIMGSSGPKNPIYFCEFYIPPTDFRLYVSELPNAPDLWL
jgi:GntR family transcriptional regulator